MRPIVALALVLVSILVPTVSGAEGAWHPGPGRVPDECGDPGLIDQLYRAFVARVVRVIDGDSLELSSDDDVYVLDRDGKKLVKREIASPFEVRLVDIDALPLSDPTGREARDRLARLLTSKTVTVAISRFQQVGTPLNVMIIFEHPINENVAQLALGLARHRRFGPYSTDSWLACKYDGAEASAKAAGRGLWSRFPIVDYTLPQIEYSRLLAEASAHDGRVIEVVGRAHMKYEGEALYPPGVGDPEPASGLRPPIALDLPSEISRLRCRFHEARVRVVGRFAVGRAGHFGMDESALTDIARFELDDPADAEAAPTDCHFRVLAIVQGDESRAMISDGMETYTVRPGARIPSVDDCRISGITADAVIVAKKGRVTPLEYGSGEAIRECGR